ncbi:hypothetical protein V8C40DRAFT_278745 [Trichoderma camerunense]
MLCFTSCTATLSCYDGNSVGHTASVALQFETDQPIQSCWDYCKRWSMTVSTATYLSLPGIIRPSNLGATAYSCCHQKTYSYPFTHGPNSRPLHTASSTFAPFA